MKNPEPERVEDHLRKLRHAQETGQPYVIATWMASVDERLEAVRTGVNVVGRKEPADVLNQQLVALRAQIERGWGAASETIERFRLENTALSARVAALEAEQKVPVPTPFWMRVVAALGMLGGGFMLAVILLLLIMVKR